MLCCCGGGDESGGGGGTHGGLLDADNGWHLDGEGGAVYVKIS